MGRHFNPMDIGDTQAEFERSNRVEDQFYDEDGLQSDITCRRCGATELEWVDCGVTDGKRVWRLYTQNYYSGERRVVGKLHVCKSQKPDPKDFAPIED